MRRCFWGSLLFLLFFFFSCKDFNKKSPIPDVPVNLELYLLRDAPELEVIGNYKTYVKPTMYYQFLGYGGILIYHNFNDEIVAFDLCCPYEVDPKIRVDSITTTGQAVCRKCFSTFDIAFGSGFPSKGPTKELLKKYKTILSGGVLRVTR